MPSSRPLPLGSGSSSGVADWVGYTATITLHAIDNKGLAIIRPLVLVGNAFDSVPVDRRKIVLCVSFPHSVAMMQLRFTSLIVS
jgi:hypothetical protein